MVEYYKTHFEENKKKMKAVWGIFNTEIINSNRKSDVATKSLLTGETTTTTTTNAKHAYHFNIFFTSVAAKLNENIAKLEKHFHMKVFRQFSLTTFIYRFSLLSKTPILRPSFFLTHNLLLNGIPTKIQ